MTAPQFAHTTLSKPTRVTPRLCMVPRQLASVRRFTGRYPARARRARSCSSLLPRAFSLMNSCSDTPLGQEGVYSRDEFLWDCEDE
jgi:hypothetical protein